MGLQQTALCVAFLTCLMRSVHCNGAALLTLSDNPVYNGETVTFNCSFAANNLLLSVTIDAYNGSQKKGSLFCSAPSGNTSRSGIFETEEIACQCGGATGKHEFTFSMVATPLLELEFHCTTTTVNDSLIPLSMTSNKTSLIIDDLQIIPNPAVFNESDNVTVKCATHLGRNTSVLQLIIVSADGSQITRSGIGLTSFALTAPLTNLHNAIARCIVSNRNSTSIFKTSVISINHINCISRHHDSWEKKANGLLNCSTYVSGFPIDFGWSVSTNVSVNSSSLNYPDFTMKDEELSSFNCTVTNVLINKIAVVMFTVNSSRAYRTEENHSWFYSQCFLTTLTTDDNFPIQLVDNTSSLKSNYWIWFSALGGCIVVIGMVITFACRRQSSNQGYEIEMTENDLYAKLIFQPTGFVPAHPRNNNLTFYRLLIAEKGVMAGLSKLTLPTTVILEYSTGCKALSEITAAISRALELPTTPKFKSVALFLPAVQKEMHVVENQTTHSRETVAGKDVHVLECFTSLANMCLDQQSDSRGIDIFNYCGPDAASLADTLTAALKVPVTVSDGYGFGESKDLKKLHASSAAKYFNFNRLAETSNNK